MRVRMTLQVPLTMPTRASMRLASRPRERASMIGMPPPTLASKAMQVSCLWARANRSGPAVGQQALVGRDHRLAELQRPFDQRRRRGSCRPSVRGRPALWGRRSRRRRRSSRARSGSGPRCFFTSRTTTWRTSNAQAGAAVEQVALGGQDLQHAAADDAAPEETDPDGSGW